MHTVPKVEELPLRSLSTAGLPVLVLGGGVTLAAVLNLLQQKRIPAYTLCAETDFVLHSRWYRSLPNADLLASSNNLEQFLRNLSLPKAVLLPCSDDWVSAVAALPPDLAQRFPSSMAPAAVLEMMVDKWSFAQFMERLRLPHPRTCLLSSMQDLQKFPEETFHNAILKPIASAGFSSRYGVKGFLVNDRGEAERRMAGLPFPIMLQEFISGPPTSGFFLDGFVDHKGRICAMFARQRLRMYPPKLGNSTLMVSVPRSEVAGAVATLEHLLEEVRYRGIFSAEFKYDERDGFLKLLEINARPWWYIEFPASCGMDVCEMAYRDALELPVQPVADYATGRRCMFVLNDLRAWRILRKQGGPNLFSWLRSWIGAETTPFHWTDPLPALAYAWQQLRQPPRRPSYSRTFLPSDPQVH